MTGGYGTLRLVTLGEKGEVAGMVRGSLHGPCPDGGFLIKGANPCFFVRVGEGAEGCGWCRLWETFGPQPL